jgi:hypothetical protein
MTPQPAPIPPEGYRLLTAEEKTKPLPADAILLNNGGPEWVKVDKSLKYIPKSCRLFAYATAITPPPQPTLLPFELAKALAGHRVVTRGGGTRHIVVERLDAPNSPYIAVADLDGVEVPVLPSGRLYVDKETPFDLFLADSASVEPIYAQPTPATSGDSMDVHYKQLEAERDAWRDSFRAINVKLINLLHAHGTGETEFKDGEKIDEMVERIVAQRDALQKRCDSLVGGLTELKRCVSEIIMPCARTITLDSEQKTIWEACTSKVDALLRPSTEEAGG